ncbi:hypothetical protein I203_101917 [Kwoniella mangroviensis CBS 8507]|uniref:uncharacterized protein n=1 Tax=Kwoniella mangroviensis CBS 8507 TaxID=1296122 RepID=UPI00305A4729
MSSSVEHLQSGVGLDIKYCLDRPRTLRVEKQRSFSGKDYVVKDEEGNVLLKSYGRAFTASNALISFKIYGLYTLVVLTCDQTCSPANPKDAFGFRTNFKDLLTGEDKEIEITLDSYRPYVRRGAIRLRNDHGTEGRNDRIEGEETYIDFMNKDHKDARSYHYQIEIQPNVDYRLIAIIAICMAHLTFSSY